MTTMVQAPTTPAPVRTWPAVYPNETPGPDRRAHPGELCPSQTQRVVRRIVRELGG